jgi:uncharacterized protein
MASKSKRKSAPVPLNAVTFEGGFWGPRVDANREVTLPIEYDQCKKTGRIDAFRLDWKPGKPRKPHQFWDSDVAKWLEAAAYSLTTHPDKKLQRQLDRVVADIEKAQQPDGYLNIFYTVVAPEQRWANLRDMHELYCAGHLMEAAVAHFEATGQRSFLDVMCRYADYIGTVFGREKGKKRGYPGHEEIELALVKLYRATGEKRYLNLSKYFVDERGRKPHYYDFEAKARGEKRGGYWARTYDYCQAHAPVREQATAEGHSVRAMYLYCAMADLAAETGDVELRRACKRLWRNTTERRMYVTGGVGSEPHGERFTFDYDLPNETAYAETCAAIGLVFWAHRMLHLDVNGGYADVMERALYNGVISGVSLDGKQFFYANPLTMHPNPRSCMTSDHIKPVRQDWFGCACCPPNIARLLASMGQYVYSSHGSTGYVHLFAQGRAKLAIAGQTVELIQRTAYPWKETVRITVRPGKAADFSLAVRIPGWCRGASLTVNGKAFKLGSRMKKGYAYIERTWTKGDRVELTLPMPVERIAAHPKVRMNAGRVALQRGPVVYCLEEVDNGPGLAAIALPGDAKLTATFQPKLLGGVTVITGKAVRQSAADAKGGLYQPALTKSEPATVKAVPYYAWCNRKPGEMLVWIRQA